jgi:hypothetical protein
VSAKVETTAASGIVVERPMYFTYGAGVKDGHVAVGATSPATVWHLAEGYTAPGFDEYLTILNPGDGPVTASITYYRKGAGPVVKTRGVAARARATVAVHEEAEGVGRNGGAGWETAAKVEGSGPIVVERPMYFTYPGGVTGGHNVLGLASTPAPPAPPGPTYEATVLADRPASYWRLGETGGGAAADRAGAAPGTYAGGARLGQPGAIAGDGDGAVGLDGADDAVVIGDRHDFAGRAAFSLELWVYPTTIDGTYRRLVSKESYLTVSAARRQGYALGYQAAGGLFCGRYVGETVTEAFGKPGLTANAWNYVVCTYDGATIRLYLNGAPVGSVASTASLADTSLALTLGQNTGGGNNLAGRLDEVAIYPTALPAARIQEHYRAATAGP